MGVHEALAIQQLSLGESNPVSFMDHAALAAHEPRFEGDRAKIIYLQFQRRVSRSGGKGGVDGITHRRVKNRALDAALNPAKPAQVVFRKMYFKNCVSFIDFHQSKIDKPPHGRRWSPAIFCLPKEVESPQCCCGLGINSGNHPGHRMAPLL